MIFESQSAVRRGLLEVVDAIRTLGEGRYACVLDPGAIVLESVAMMQVHTHQLNPQAKEISAALLDKHFWRKHGPTAYYGQK